MKSNEEERSMNTIRVRMRLDSDTPPLPELKPLIGKSVEIVVREETQLLPETSPYGAFLALAGQDLVDSEAYKRLRSASMNRI
jgi:hypothetical protein